MTRPTFSLQPLEPRRFLSAAPLHVEDCPEVVEARQDLQEVEMQLRHDRSIGRHELAGIRAQIIEELHKLYAEKGDELREAVAPLQHELRAAIRAQAEARRVILEDLQAIRDKWHPTLQADLQAVLEARAAGDADALAEALDQFHADRNALYAELNPLKAELREVTEETNGAITAARLAIEDKLAEFSLTLAELLERLRTRSYEIGQKLLAGHNAVMDARQELADAIAECREEHADEHATA